MNPEIQRLLSAVADALNACERNGVVITADHGGILCRYGYVIAAGDPKLGHRWAVRMKTEPPAPGESPA